MAKITFHQLQKAKEWEAWGDKLGWKYVTCETGTPTIESHAIFATGDKDHTEKISLVTRQALQRQDKPKLEVAG